MSLKRKRQLKRRIRRVEKRLNWLEKRQDMLQDAETNALRGPLKELVEKVLKDSPFLQGADTDDSGKVEFDELAEAVRDKIDDLVDVGDEMIESLSDWGLDVVTDVAIYIYNKTDERIARRIERLSALLAQLKADLAAA